MSQGVIRLKAKDVDYHLQDDPILNALLYGLSTYLSQSEAASGDKLIGDSILESVGDKLLSFLECRGFIQPVGKNLREDLVQVMKLFVDRGYCEELALVKLAADRMYLEVVGSFGCQGMGEASKECIHQHEVRADPLLMMTFAVLARNGYDPEVTRLQCDLKRKALMAEIVLQT